MVIRRLATVAVLAPLAFLAAAGGPGTAGPADAGRARLRRGAERTLRRLDRDLRGVSGYLIRDLTTGETFEKDADAIFPAASTIKLPILLDLYRRAEEGTIDISKPLPLDPARRVGGGGVLEKLSPPYPRLSAAHLAVLMMDFSDNFATNRLLDLLGLASVDGRMAAWGFPGVRLRRRMMDFEAARAGRDNVASPRGLAGLAERLQRGALLNPRHTRLAIDIMKRNERSWIKRGLPAGIEAADKEGDLDGVRCDVGLVFVPGPAAGDPPRPFAIAVMTARLADDEEGTKYIGAVARAACDYFTILAAASEAGNRPAV